MVLAVVGRRLAEPAPAGGHEFGLVLPVRGASRCSVGVVGEVHEGLVMVLKLLVFAVKRSPIVSYVRSGRSGLETRKKGCGELALNAVFTAYHLLSAESNA